MHHQGKPIRQSSCVMPNPTITTIEQLEQRRDDSARVMWLAPTLTIAAQAFLLQTLANSALSGFARVIVLLAGLAASFSALWTLVRARAREVQYSERIRECLEVLGLPRVDPASFGEIKPKTARALDRRVIRFGAHRDWPAFFFWGAALLLFMAADLAVFCAA